MREIKFNVWDAIRKEMLGGFTLGSMNKDWWVGKIPLQYTGLKDKRGVEIYEGDIIYYKAKQYDKKLKVKFDDGGYCLSENAISTYELTRVGISTSDIFEVIGNIYENSELLKGA